MLKYTAIVIGEYADIGKYTAILIGEYAEIYSYCNWRIC